MHEQVEVRLQYLSIAARPAGRRAFRGYKGLVVRFQITNRALSRMRGDRGMGLLRTRWLSQHAPRGYQ